MNNVNVNMANIGPMSGPVGAPMPMMGAGAGVPPQGGARQLQADDGGRTLLNTYIYEYFLRYGMFECARAILNNDPQVKVQKDGAGGRRRDDNGNLLGNGVDGDPMDTDSKDDAEPKRPDDLPAPQVPTPLPDSCFLYEWFSLFWDMLSAQKGKGSNTQVNQYVNITQVMRTHTLTGRPLPFPAIFHPSPLAVWCRFFSALPPSLSPYRRTLPSLTSYVYFGK